MTKIYQPKILSFLSQTTEPVDVEKIRTACGIGNWNTALTHCLDLLVQGRIHGQKTSKGWVFWAHQEKQLEPWEEARGNYEALKVSEEKVTLVLTHTLKTLTISFPKDTPEAQTLIQTLTNTPKGTKIALIKTDIPEKPLVVRTFTDRTVAVKRCLQTLLFRKMILCELCLKSYLSCLFFRKRQFLIFRYVVFGKVGC